MIDDFWQLCPLMKFSVSVHYLPTVVHIQLNFKIWIRQSNTQVKFKFIHGSMIFGRVKPLSLKIIWNFQFPFIISRTVIHIQLKFNIWICERNAQLKFEYGPGSKIFGRVMPLSLWKQYEFDNFQCWLTDHIIRRRLWRAASTFNLAVV
jgi:hypothetical protein